jgi:hypothetical protein
VGVLLIALLLGGCGGGSKGHSSVTGTASSTAPTTAVSTVTTAASGTPAVQTLRCPHSVTLPGPGKYAGQVATVFIVGSAPKESGCTFVTGWMAEWIKGGASPGGYAIGSLAGYRCDEPLLAANQGPLGEKYSHYTGVIPCDQIDESAGDPRG